MIIQSAPVISVPKYYIKSSTEMDAMEAALAALEANINGMV
jgi:hypothetical protein